MTKKLSLILILLTFLSACGDGDDSDSTTTINVPQEEEDTRNRPGGRTPTTRSCLTSNQRENIRTFLNRLADLRTFDGSATDSTGNDDGSTTDRTLTGNVAVIQDAEDNWLSGFGFCDVQDPSSCIAGQSRMTFKEGCFFVLDGNQRARINSTSASSLSFSFTDPDDQSRVSERWFISGGRLCYVETIREDGKTTYRFNFNQE